MPKGASHRELRQDVWSHHRPCPRKLVQKAYLWNVYLNLLRSESDRRRIQVHNSREPNLAVHQFPSDTLAHPLLSRNRYGKRLLKHPRPTVFQHVFVAHWPLTENVGKMFAVFRPTCQDSETQTCHRRFFFADAAAATAFLFVRLDRRSTSNSLARNKNMRAFSLVQ